MSIVRTLTIGIALLAAAIFLNGCRDDAGTSADAAKEAEPAPDDAATDIQPDPPAPDDAASDNPELVWHPSLDDALAEATKRDSLVVVDAYADWCGWCKVLDEKTLSTKQVRAELKSFALCKLDTEKYPAISKRLRVRGLPTTLVLDKTGKIIASKAGFVPPDVYIAFLKQAVRAAGR
jgi:thiol:disulfide interchange protein